MLTDHYRDTESRYVKTQKFVTVRQEVGEEFSSYLRRVDKLSRSIGMFEHPTANINEHGQGIRRELALVLAVNVLRDETLCRELIAKPDLTWKSLGDILRSRATAIDTVDKLHANVKSEPDVAVNSIHDSGSDYVHHRHSRKNRRHTFSDRPSSSSDWRRRCNSDSSSSNNSEQSKGRDRYRAYTRNSCRSGTRGSAKSSSEEEAGCYQCGSHRHVIRECPQVRCYMCNRNAHMACDCRESQCVRCGGKPHSIGKRCPLRTPPPSPGERSKKSVRFRDSKSTPSKDYTGSLDCD